MSRATSLKALVGNLRFIVAWKTWAVLVVFVLGVAVGAAWCLVDVQAGEPRDDGAERLDSGDGAAALLGNPSIVISEPSWHEPRLPLDIPNDKAKE